MAATTIAKGTWELRSNQEFTITSGSGKTVTCTPAAPMVGMAALVQRLAAAGLQARYRPTRGTLAVLDTDVTPLFETRSAALVERLLAQHQGVSHAN